ncbi:MAG: hypothetical protein E3J43_08105 [Candidatus Heimdallarchaeota archaeon]|nr:MAG: hypothetical protein E3J43_08105 [Candidatus Heimdallarchaeota archaeon]
MKIYLHKETDRSAIYMTNISRILKHSLEDIGHIVSSYSGFYSECDVALFIRKPFDRQKRKGIYHILYQVELYIENQEEVDEWYDFGWDEIWDSNEVNERGIFVPIGYHPCLKFKKVSNMWIRDIGLLGGANKRRNKFREKVKFPWQYMSDFDPVSRGISISETRINLNLHAYDNSSYVEWDRIGHFFANDCFFISEYFPCEIEVPMFKTPEEYDTLIDQYINKPALRKKQAEKQGKEFREKFDMRDILKRVL